MSDPIDDLPTRTAEHIGETQSRKRFDQLVGDPYFIARGESENDYGVDVTVEALDERGSPSNFRAHAQLKASIKKPNQDGSFSYAVDRTNLNYLLNHPRSFYVFLARNDDTLYYRLAEAEYRDREADGSDWQTQDSVTIRFTDALDQVAVAHLRDEILRVNRYLRNLNLKLVTQAITLQSTVVYDPAAKKVVDVGTAAAELRTKGLAMVASGYPEVAKTLLDIVPRQSFDGSLWLVSAYMNYSLGLVYDAANDADRALSYGGLDDDKTALAKYLSASCRFALGHLDQSGVQAAFDAIEKDYPKSVTACYARLDRLRRVAVSGDKTVVDELGSLATEIEGRGKNFAEMALQARLVHLEGRYFLLNARYNAEVKKYRVTAAMGVDKLFLAERAKAVGAIVAEMQEILRAFDRLIDRSVELKHAGLWAEVVYVRELCLLQDRMTLAKVAPPAPGDEAVIRKLTESAVERLDAASKAFEAAQSADSALRARMLQVDVLWIGGQRDRARALAKDVAAMGAALGLGQISKRALDVVAGDSPLAEWDAIPNLYEV